MNSASSVDPAISRGRPIHPLMVRIAHWLNALAIVIMITSGWRIYDASPLFSFEIPSGLTLGGWLAGALQWHFAAMWLLVLNGTVYVTYGIFSGHFRRRFLPLSARAVAGEFAGLMRGRLTHDLGRYNAIQRLAYVVVILLGVLLVLSGLSIWKPVQFQGLAAFFGGYDNARLVHFLAMAGVTGFIAIHLALVLLVPRTLLPMIIGRAPRVST